MEDDDQECKILNIACILGLNLSEGKVHHEASSPGPKTTTTRLLLPLNLLQKTELKF